MEVSAHDQPAWSEDIVIETPKIFDCVESIDAAQRLSPGRLLLPPEIRRRYSGLVNSCVDKLRGTVSFQLTR
jgi:hypothetical protein|tara:strand:- start:1186 stop:1401 length:216 start_codon:yes stop_codon:yes gene_type:complete